MVDGAISLTLQITDLYSPTMARLYLGVSKMTLWRWTNEGYVKHIKLDHIYYQKDELDRVKALPIESKHYAGK